MILPARPDPDAGERLTDKEFFADFHRRYSHTTNYYKLERAQHVAHPQEPSWRALTHGRWEEALDLIEAERARLETEHRAATAFGTTIRHVRFVEEPLTPYLQWRLHVLRLSDDVTGGTIRVLPTMLVAADEEAYGSALPEISILDDTAMYLHGHDVHGVHHHIRYTDPGTIQAWCDYIASLWGSGWPLADYFNRYVQHLPAPQPSTRPPNDLRATTDERQTDQGLLLLPHRRTPHTDRFRARRRSAPHLLCPH